MILPLLHTVVCLALLFAAIGWKVRHPREGAHRFLFPFIVGAGIAGGVLVASYAMELFVAYYSGTAVYQFHGPYWALCVAFILPMLPALGVIPWVGRKPVLMAVLAVLAAFPGVTERMLFL